MTWTMTGTGTYWNRSAIQTSGCYTITRIKSGYNAVYPWMFELAVSGIRHSEHTTTTAAKNAAIHHTTTTHKE